MISLHDASIKGIRNDDAPLNSYGISARLRLLRDLTPRRFRHRFLAQVLQLLTGKALPETSMIVVDAWDLSLDRIAVSRDENCPCCALKQFDFLNMQGQQAITLCGRNAVQVRAAFERRPDFKALAGRLGVVGAVRVNDHLLRLEAPPYQLTLFEDGRAIVKGTPDPKLARSLVARWVGV